MVRQRSSSSWRHREAAATASGMIIAVIVALPSSAEEPVSMDEAYDAWRRSVAVPYAPGGDRSDGTASLNKEYRKLVGMGPRILPDIIERMSRDRDSWRLAGIVQNISGDSRLGAFFRGRGRLRPDLFLKYWKDVLERTTTDCEAALRRWDKARANIPANEEMVFSRKITYFNTDLWIVGSRVEKTELGEAFDELAGIGIAALPFLVAQLKDGRHDLLPIAERVTRHRGSVGGTTPRKRSKSFIAWWSANSQDWLIPVDLLSRQCEGLEGQPPVMPAP